MKDRSFYFKGGKRAVLLFHAYSSTPNDVRMLGRGLEKENYTVYSPTFSGHGTHDLEDVLQFPPSQWVEDGKKALQFLRDEGHDEVAVFGLSLGGIIATKLMLEENILASGTFSSPAVHNKTSKVHEEFMATMIHLKKRNGESQETIEKRLPELEQKLADQLSALQEMVADMVPQYGAVTKPVFIGQSEKDELIDSNEAFALRDALTQADVDFHWYENSPHAVTVGPERKELEEDLLKFLSQLEWTEDR